jgi:hypothetical protein
MCISIPFQEISMKKVLVYYPFTMAGWFGKSAMYTFEKAKYEIKYCSENNTDSEKRFAFQSVVFDGDSKLYIVGHCGAGEDQLYSQSTSNTEESITYADLAAKVATYSVPGQTAPGKKTVALRELGNQVCTTIKVLACESGAAPFGAARAVFQLLGTPVPSGLLSFAQKFWNELHNRWGFNNCTCHAYTRSLFWNMNLQTCGETISGVKELKEQKDRHRFFVDDSGELQRAAGCIIVLAGKPAKLNVTKASTH